MAVSRIIRAPRRAVYAACLDPDALITWRVPENMVGRVHAFEAREGGGYRMSLTYREPAQGPGGKTSADTDTFQGRFIELVPDEKIVEAVRFESDDPGFGGEMTITTRLTDTSDGTEIIMWFQDLPPGVRPEDNELGTRQALHKLAKLLE
jgi:uncharacterized protein YndB with AHSA1/START domain